MFLPESHIRAGLITSFSIVGLKRRDGNLGMADLKRFKARVLSRSGASKFKGNSRGSLNIGFAQHYQDKPHRKCR